MRDLRVILDKDEDPNNKGDSNDNEEEKEKEKSFEFESENTLPKWSEKYVKVWEPPGDTYHIASLWRQSDTVYFIAQDWSQEQTIDLWSIKPPQVVASQSVRDLMGGSGPGLYRMLTFVLCVFFCLFCCLLLVCSTIVKFVKNAKKEKN